MSNEMETKRTVKERDPFYVTGIFTGLTIIVLAVEFLSQDHADYMRLQSKSVYALSFVVIYRIVSLPKWPTYYRETVNYLRGMAYDTFPLTSVLNVALDVFFLALVLFWVEVDKVHFVEVPVVPLVYVALGMGRLAWALLLKYRYAGE